ncbi:MAG: alpha/beta fold hydrolase [Xanthomonadales bacterium]|nr:alpha/beta fold hydrolase [Xanthomonadales bacterium]
MIPPFRPPSLLRNAHVQSVLSSSALRRRRLLKRRPAVLTQARQEIIECDDGVRLESWRSPRPDAIATAILFHGWEGNAGSNYMVDTADRLYEAGFEVVRLNFRDHGDTHHLNRGLFNSCRLAEVVSATRILAERARPRPVVLVGYSLGGNFALRVARVADFPIAQVFAVSPVISPSAGLAAIQAAPWFYEYYFMRKWRRSLARKCELYPEDYGWETVLAEGDLLQLTGWLVDCYTEFPHIDAYLDGYSIAGDRLADLRVPGVIMTAADDPVIPVADFEGLQLPERLRLEVTEFGGHCGFIDSLALTSWAPRVITAELIRRLKGESPARAGAPNERIMEAG